MESSELLQIARKARENAYAPYSGFAVGAALLAQDGQVFTGCNIESSVFSPSICAERVALSKAISEGVKGFTAIAIVGAPSGAEPEEVCYPCGVCRQVLSEHVRINEFQIIVEDHGRAQVCTLAELLPKAFVLENEH